MVFKCQSDSFLTQYVSKVVSCNKLQDTYEIILEDTILFPEGGGQPCDYGFLNTLPVNKVVRRLDQAVHITSSPLVVGDEVTQTIDWPRRFDHMQQHSGQHLLSAVIEQLFEWATASWWLGEEVSYVELETPKITQEQIKQAEDHINGLIRENRSVVVEVYPEDTSKDELEKVKARGLPEDHKGDIRVINIQGVDRNMCCGTHVTNLSQLQAIKLLFSEKSKRKNKTFLYFLVGNRVFKRLEDCLEREQQLMKLLKSNPTEHVDLVDKLQKKLKLTQKHLQTTLKEVAANEAKNFKSNQIPIFSMHKKEAEPDFMDTFIREVGDTSSFLFLSTGDDKGAGSIVLYGEQAVELGPKVAELLDGKGAGKGKKFQAKVGKMSNRTKAEELIRDNIK